MASASAEPDELTIIAPKPAYGRSLMERREGDSSLTDSLRALLYREASGRRRLAADRRATPRVQAEVICVERMAGTRFLRTTHDLSTFGLSTRYGHLHPVGTKLDLELQLPDESSRPVQVRARVVGHLDRRSGMRLAFRSPSRDAVRRLHRYLFARMEASGTA